MSIKKSIKKNSHVPLRKNNRILFSISMIIGVVNNSDNILKFYGHLQ